MPEVTLNPINQCTFDDPTAGADLSSAVSSAATSKELPTPAPAPPCLATEPGAGGATSQCSDELVRKFAAPAGPGPSLAPKQSCAAEAVSVGSNCGKVAYEAVRKQYNVVDIASCAAAVVAFGLCEFNGD